MLNIDTEAVKVLIVFFTVLFIALILEQYNKTFMLLVIAFGLIYNIHNVYYDKDIKKYKF